MRAVAESNDHATRGTTGIGGTLRLARVAGVLVFGFAALIVPHLMWRVARADPSPIASLYLRWVSVAAGLRVSVRGETIAPHAMVVANHISWTDILALGAASPITFVAKSEVRGWPGLGLLARLAPTLFVRRGARGEARVQGDTIAAALRHGPVLLFAEGTTSDGSHVRPFRSTLFAAATRVQPVAIAYDPPPGVCWSRADRAEFAWDGDKEFLPHLIAVIAAGGANCTLTVLPPITHPGRKTLATAARAAIVEALAR